MSNHPAIAARPLMESFWVLLSEALVALPGAPPNTAPETRAAVARCVRWERFLLALIEESPDAAWGYLGAPSRVSAIVGGRRVRRRFTIKPDALQRPSNVVELFPRHPSGPPSPPPLRSA